MLRNIYLELEVTYHLEGQLLMTATTADYASDERKGVFSNIADSIRLALKLKDQFKGLTIHKNVTRRFAK